MFKKPSYDNGCNKFRNLKNCCDDFDAAESDSEFEEEKEEGELNPKLTKESVKIKDYIIFLIVSLMNGFLAEWIR